MTRIEELQKEIELLKELIALKEKLWGYEVQKIEYPYYPAGQPFQPQYPTIPYTPTPLWYGGQWGGTFI